MSDDADNKKVVDLDAARQRLRAGTGFPQPTSMILTALDTLALALTDHNHTWSDTERAVYETAVGYLMQEGCTFESA